MSGKFISFRDTTGLKPRLKQAGIDLRLGSRAESILARTAVEEFLDRLEKKGAMVKKLVPLRSSEGRPEVGEKGHAVHLDTSKGQSRPGKAAG